MNNQAPELSPEARRLINEARGADDPTAEDHARVKARWLASVAAVAGVSSLTEAARAAGGIGWGFKAAGAALAIAAGAIGLNFALDAGNSADSSANPAETAQEAPLPGWNGSSPERFQKTPRSRSEAAHGLAPQARTAEPTPVVALGDDARLPAAAAQPDVTGGSAAAPDSVEASDLMPRTGMLQPAVSEPGGSPTSRAPRGALSAVVSPTVVSPTVVSPAAAVSPTVVSPTAVRARPLPRAVAARSSAPKTPEKSATSAPPAPVEAAPAAPGPSGQLSEELAVLSDVRSSIQEGSAGRALELLSRYESRFGQPILGMEADALRVDALCKAGQREAARESARAFQNEWPGSPLERRVSAACP